MQISKSVKLSVICNMADFKSCERSSQISFHGFLEIVVYDLMSKAERKAIPYDEYDRKGRRGIGQRLCQS